MVQIKSKQKHLNYNSLAQVATECRINTESDWDYETMKSVAPFLFDEQNECIDLDENPSGKWKRWSEKLWDKAAQEWLVRNGQDHFYRETVVIPALFRAFDLLYKHPLSIVDLGCGDGHSASLLLAGFKRNLLSLSVVLVDRSRQLLSAARRDLNLASSPVIQADFTSRFWSRQLPPLQHPTVFLALFLIQEMPDLSPFFNGVRELMSDDDCLFSVVPDPDYVESLRQSSQIKSIMAGSSNDDWLWAGGYPISTASGSLVLPHFQRTLEKYRRAASSCGLKLIRYENLCVPNTLAAQTVFSDTVYGRAIIGQTSAKLLMFQVDPAPLEKR